MRGPFDFSNNWGAFRASLSLGQGYQLGNKEVAFDAARFNDIIQDDRELEDDLAFGELGIGLGWERVRKNNSIFKNFRIFRFVIFRELLWTY